MDIEVLCKGIAVQYAGPGHYWASDGQRSLDLGDCATLKDVIAAVIEMVQAGNGTESWHSWKAAHE